MSVRRPAPKKPATKPAAKRAVSKAVKAGKPAKAAARPRAPKAPPVEPEPLRPPRLIAAALVAVLFLAGAYSSSRQKLAQHVVATRLGPILRQGDGPENISGLQALKPVLSGGFATLLHRPDGWRVQVWDDNLNLSRTADIAAKKVGDLADLASLKDGQLWVASVDGQFWKLDEKLQPGKPWAPGIKGVRSLEALPDGGAVAMDVNQGAFWRLGADGKALASVDNAEAAASKTMAAFPDGGLALMQIRRNGLWITVLNSAFELERRFEVSGVVESSPTRLAVSGNAVLVNDSHGSVGVVYYDRSGKPLGNTVGVGNFPIAHPGWVGGDPSGKYAYIHYADGLVRVGLPWGGQP